MLRFQTLVWGTFIWAYFGFLHCLGVSSSSPSGDVIVASPEFYRLSNNTNKVVYENWSRGQVPYYLSANYTPYESSLIRRAIRRVSDELKQCITFYEVSPLKSVFKVFFTPQQTNASVAHTLCYSHPGYASSYAKEGAKEQRLAVARGPYGCLPADGKLRGVMRAVVNLLGKRNEHQRGDRDRYITVNNSNVLLSTAYLHTVSDAYWLSLPYDYNSITHNLPTDFAAPGSLAFKVKNPPYKISDKDRLSVYDCQMIAHSYGCDPARCGTPPSDSINNPGQNEAGHSNQLPNAAHDQPAEEHEKPHWGYKVHQTTDEIAPGNWSKLSPHCASARQSPIMIKSNLLNLNDNLRQLNMVNYDEMPIDEKWTLVNNGHSVQFTAVFEDIPRLQGGKLGAAYDFMQFHFHWGSDDSRGSEHLIDGKSFPLELHIVHRKVHESEAQALNDSTGVAVLGVVFRVVEASQAKSDYSSHLDAMVAAVKKVRIPLKPLTTVIPGFDLDDLIPDIVQYYRYLGSLTTPPCSEVVQWSVLKEPLLITKEQLNVFRALRGNSGGLIEDNYRPLQKVNSRPVSLYAG
ncbi:putative Carbonic anhydrase 2 [Hypsibius exemplaris]|uniref:Multifunctional fusion protein n=1 Tax=Hypsibius exemplaris TaxID=2072580 RepID=A0A1W0X228_HYPEX|nr:putative Carbonic anhydrase 2 [Hypsibius exemplaris]